MFLNQHSKQTKSAKYSETFYEKYCISCATESLVLNTTTFPGFPFPIIAGFPQNFPFETFPNSATFKSGEQHKAVNN